MKILVSALLLGALSLTACASTGSDRSWRKQAEMMDMAVPR